MTDDPKSVAARLLIVDDEPRLRDLYTSQANDWGFSPTSAGTGRDAIAAASARPYGVVLLDLNLPDMDGLECLAAMREKQPHLQAVVLTGYGSLDAARKAIHLGIVEFLEKPCPLGEIEASLDRAKGRFLDHWRAAEPAAPPETAPGEDLAVLERNQILKVLASHGGNRAAAARQLGISERTLYYRLSRYSKGGEKL